MSRNLLFVLALIALVVTIGAVLVKNSSNSLAAPKRGGTPSNVQISVVAPNGGEQFKQGTPSAIKWGGGYTAVAVGLATADADTNHAIALPPSDTPFTGPQQNGTTGRVIGFIKTTENGGVHLPNSTISWDGLKVCNFHLNMDPDKWCVDVIPGSYKIFVWSNGADNQSMCIGSGEGPTGKYTKSSSKEKYGCNWDLSDAPFTIF